MPFLNFSTIFFTIIKSFFKKKNSVDSFEIEHKYAHFQFRVHSPFEGVVFTKWQFNQCEIQIPPAPLQLCNQRSHLLWIVYKLLLISFYLCKVVLDCLDLLVLSQFSSGILFYSWHCKKHQSDSGFHCSHNKECNSKTEYQIIHQTCGKIRVQQ